MLSIPTKFYNVSMSELVCIDHFLNDVDSFHVDIGILVFDCHTPSSPSTATPTPSEIVDSPFPRSC